MKENQLMDIRTLSQFRSEDVIQIKENKIVVKDKKKLEQVLR